MSEYTPDTEAVRDAYASFWERRYGPAVWYERCQDEFDRWLEAEKAKWQAEAWEQGAAAPRMQDGSELPAVDNPYREQA